MPSSSSENSVSEPCVESFEETRREDDDGGAAGNDAADDDVDDDGDDDGEDEDCWKATVLVDCCLGLANFEAESAIESVLPVILLHCNGEPILALNRRMRPLSLGTACLITSSPPPDRSESTEENELSNISLCFLFNWDVCDVYKKASGSP
jgi:hypothetical protein